MKKADIKRLKRKLAAIRRRKYELMVMEARILMLLKQAEGGASA